MSVANYFAIAFSYDLAHADAETKKGALEKLQDYFEQKPEINTGNETYHPASYAIAPFLDGSRDLSQVFRARVIHAELTEKERLEIKGLGFAANLVGPEAFTFYSSSQFQEASP